MQTAAEREAAQKIAREQAEAQQASLKAKQARMKSLEAERLRTAPPLSDLEKEDLEKKGVLRNRANQLKNENKDEVKKMNQLVSEFYSRSTTPSVLLSERSSSRKKTELGSRGSKRSKG